MATAYYASRISPNQFETPGSNDCAYATQVSPAGGGWLKSGTVIYYRASPHGRRDGTLSDIPLEVFLGVPSRPAYSGRAEGRNDAGNCAQR
jgi:hypothetical protein